MIKKALLIILAVGMVTIMTVGVVAAQSEREPEPVAEDERPPSGGDCEIASWQLYILEKLAERYETTVEEMQVWFCAGYRFSEIALAYEISLASETPVETIFAMRAEGKNWLEILEELGLIPELPPPGSIELPDNGDFGGGIPVPDICAADGTDPNIERLAQFYGLTYEQVYQWICGPFTYEQFDHDTFFPGDGFEIPTFPLDGFEVPNPLDNLDVESILEDLKDQLPELPWGNWLP